MTTNKFKIGGTVLCTNGPADADTLCVITDTRGPNYIFITYEEAGTKYEAWITKGDVKAYPGTLVLQFNSNAIIECIDLDTSIKLDGISHAVVSVDRKNFVVSLEKVK